MSVDGQKSVQKTIGYYDDAAGVCVEVPGLDKEDADQNSGVEKATTSGAPDYPQEASRLRSVISGQICKAPNPKNHPAHGSEAYRKQEIFCKNVGMDKRQEYVDADNRLVVQCSRDDGSKLFNVYDQDGKKVESTTLASKTLFEYDKAGYKVKETQQYFDNGTSTERRRDSGGDHYRFLNPDGRERNSFCVPSRMTDQWEKSADHPDWTNISTDNPKAFAEELHCISNDAKVAKLLLPMRTNNPEDFNKVMFWLDATASPGQANRRDRIWALMDTVQTSESSVSDQIKVKTAVLRLLAKRAPDNDYAKALKNLAGRHPEEGINITGVVMVTEGPRTGDATIYAEIDQGTKTAEPVQNSEWSTEMKNELIQNIKQMLQANVPLTQEWIEQAPKEMDMLAEDFPNAGPKLVYHGDDQVYRRDVAKWVEGLK